MFVISYIDDNSVNSSIKGFHVTFILVYMFHTFVHVYLILLYVFSEIRCGIIVGDSIVKHLPLIEGVQLSAFPGTTITRLQHQLSTINLSAFSFIIVHVGTNNVAKGHSVAFMCSAFADLVNYLRARAPGIRIIISSVLPRPVDDDSSRSIIYELNAYLEKNMAKDLNFHFLKSYRPFCFKGQIKRHLFARLDGGLHLNSEGCARLHNFFLRVISNL